MRQNHGLTQRNMNLNLSSKKKWNSEIELRRNYYLSIEQCEIQTVRKPTKVVIEHLVGGIPLWKIWVKVSWDDDIPNWMENHKNSMVPNQQPAVVFLCIVSWVQWTYSIYQWDPLCLSSAFHDHPWLKQQKLQFNERSSWGTNQLWIKSWRLSSKQCDTIFYGRKLWKITIFDGEIHYRWPFSIAMFV